MGEAAPPGDEIIDQRIGRASVEGDDLTGLAEIGDVADPAPIEHGQRLGDRRAHRRVIEGDERRAFAPRCDVGRAEIADDIDAKRGGGARAIAELASEALARPMQHGLPVQPDQGDATPVDGELAKEGFDRADMGVGDGDLKLF